SKRDWSSDVCSSDLYWVLRVDTNYQHALVGTPDHKFLWLLARTPTMEVDEQENYLAHARAEGYNLADWIRTPQSGRHVTDEMLQIGRASCRDKGAAW